MQLSNPPARCHVINWFAKRSKPVAGLGCLSYGPIPITSLLGSSPASWGATPFPSDQLPCRLSRPRIPQHFVPGKLGGRTPGGRLNGLRLSIWAEATLRCEWLRLASKQTSPLHQLLLLLLLMINSPALVEMPGLSFSTVRLLDCALLSSQGTTQPSLAQDALRTLWTPDPWPPGLRGLGRSLVRGPGPSWLRGGRGAEVQA